MAASLSIWALWHQPEDASLIMINLLVDCAHWNSTLTNALRPAYTKSHLNTMQTSWNQKREWQDWLKTPSFSFLMQTSWLITMNVTLIILCRMRTILMRPTQKRQPHQHPYLLIKVVALLQDWVQGRQLRMRLQRPRDGCLWERSRKRVWVVWRKTTHGRKRPA